MEEKEVTDGLFALISKVSKRVYIPVIAFALLLSFMGFNYAQKVDIENEFVEYFPPEFEEVKVMDEMENEFSGFGRVNLLVQVDGIMSKSVLEDENLELMHDLEEDLSLVEGVKEIQSALELGKGREEILGNPGREEFVTRDEKYALIKIKVSLAEFPDSDMFMERVLEVIDRTDIQKGVEVTPAGGIAFGYAFNQAIKAGQVKAGMVSIIMIIAMLFLIFRSLTGAIFPVIPIFVGVSVAFGSMYFFNIPFTAMTIMFGAVSMGLGIDFSIHLMHRYYEEVERGESEALTVALHKVGRVIIATSASTIAAFGAMLFSKMRISAEYGLVSAVAIIFCALAVILVLPSLLILERKIGIRKVNLERASSFFGVRGVSSIPFHLSRVSLKRPYTVVLVLGVMLLPAFYGLGNLYFLTDMQQWLPSGNKISMATNTMEDEFRAVDSMYILVDADDIREPGVLKAMADMQAEFMDVKNVISTSSIADFVTDFRNTKGEIGQIPADTRGTLVSQDYTKGVIYITIEDVSSRGSENSELVREIKDRMDYVYVPEDARFTLGGFPVLSDIMFKLMGSGGERAFLVSLVLVLLILFLTFKKASYVMLALVPMLFSILMTMGTMGVFGIPMTVVTMVTSALLLGVGIDYSIHYLSRYREERRNGISMQQAIDITSKTVGRAIFAATATTMIGFLSLMSIPVSPVSDFGKATALGILYTGIFTPLILASAIAIGERYRINSLLDP